MSSQGGVDFSKRIFRGEGEGGKVEWETLETLRESFPRLGREGWIVVDRVQIVDFDRPPRDRTEEGGRRRCVERHSSGCMIDRTRDKLEDWKWEIVWNAKRWRRWKISNWSIGVWWEGSDRGISWKIGKSRDVVENAAQRAHKAADERVYGVVTRAATENGPGKSQDA